ncbi:hypothetical protein [uncultured Paraglaciecola sp.]|uniref:hypothetical protein n=1 Tax=uncultured Paraglaciecola sp. TaxID=1765024 RepID=UPI0026211EA9|nr:hypothetical protein [uncultured Paraglaciecola sp.]
MTKTLSQRSWEWIKTRPEFLSKELASAMDVNLHQAQMVISHLKDLGAIKSSHRGYKGTVYLAVEGATPHLPGKNPTSPRKKCIRQKIWNAIRFLNKFTIPEIMAAADCSKANVESYLTHLRRYGYVATVRKQNVKLSMAKRRGHLNQYLLINNTGHKYPVVSAKGMRDQNQNILIPLNATKKDNKNELV